MELYTKVFNDATNNLDDELGVASAANMREAIQHIVKRDPRSMQWIEDLSARLDGRFVIR